MKERISRTWWGTDENTFSLSFFPCRSSNSLQWVGLHGKWFSIRVLEPKMEEVRETDPCKELGEIKSLPVFLPSGIFVSREYKVM